MELKDVLSFIENADEDAVNCMLDAVFDRRMDLFPEWETIHFVLPRYNIAERRRILEAALNMLIARGRL